MSDDTELQQFRDQVNCAAILERAGGWRLDKKESTRRALKYRRGEGEIVIVNHDGRGWWDPTSTAKGDVFSLVQHLQPRLNFGQVRQELRRLVGIAPSYHAEQPDRRQKGRGDVPAPAARWSARPALRIGSPAWDYLTAERRLPRDVLLAAVAQDAVREGFRGSAWFAHRARGSVCHVDVRGPAWKGSLTGGSKTLFVFGRLTSVTRRVAITEAPIDALSLAALEGQPANTLYAATGGGMGPGTITAIEALLARMPTIPDAQIAIGTDANAAGDNYAARLAEMAAAAGVAAVRLRPPEGLDWNDVIRRETP